MEYFGDNIREGFQFNQVQAQILDQQLIQQSISNICLLSALRSKRTQELSRHIYDRKICLFKNRLPFSPLQFSSCSPKCKSASFINTRSENISMFKYEHRWAFVLGHVSQPGMHNQCE